MKTAILHPVTTKRPYILNIGLNVRGVEPKRQLGKILKMFPVQCVKEAEYDGIKERTAVVRLEIEPDQVKFYIPCLCEYLNQNMIPVWGIREQHGKMYYNPNYMGRSVPFIKKYFITK